MQKNGEVRTSKSSLTPNPNIAQEGESAKVRTFIDRSGKRLCILGKYQIPQVSNYF